ncbi:MAG: NAD(P)H-hydrate dehydratase [Spirochaetales bacterium]
MHHAVSWKEPVFSCKEAVELDHYIQTEYQLPALVLMENAGRSTAEYLLSYTEGPWVIVVGKGNNGGDALVAARHMTREGRKDFTLVLAQKEVGELGALHLETLKKEGCKILFYEEDKTAVLQGLQEASTLIDGLFGVGLRGSIRKGPTLELVQAMNDSGKRIVALDLPSGLGDDYLVGYPIVHATETLCYEAWKLPMFFPEARTHCGKLHKLTAGFPSSALATYNVSCELVTSKGLYSLLTFPPPWTYKNKRGHIAVLASSLGTTGAGILAAEAGLRSGAGLVSLFVDSSIYSVVASQSKSIMVKPLTHDFPQGEEFHAFSAFLIGPGWGRSMDRLPWLKKILRPGTKGVIDADGIFLLKILIDSGYSPDLAEWILTPHPGEFSRLTGCEKEEYETNPLPRAKEFVSKYPCTLVLKGHVTYIISPEKEVRILDGMNPLLATGGTGDVLSGLAAGFLAQGMAPYSAATAAVLVLSEGAYKAEEQYGFFLSQDLLPFLSKTVVNYAKKA